MQYFVGLIGFPAGILLIVYRERVKYFTGDFAAAEKWFGPGGTYTLFLIIGLVVSIGSLMYALGTLQIILAPLFNILFLGSK